MAIVGRRLKSKSNRIQKIGGFPLEFSKGSVSVNINFESHPTGTVNIVDIPESEIANYRRTYNVQGKELTLFTNTDKPIYFRINGYAEVENFIYQGNETSQPIKTFDIALNLEGGHLINASRDIFIRNNSKDFIPSDAPRINLSNGKILLSSLARAAKLKYLGFNEKIEVDNTSGSNLTLQFQSSLETFLRTKTQTVDYSGPFIRTASYNRGRIWSVGLNDILTSIEVSRNKPLEFQNTLLNPKDGDSFSRNSNKKTKEELLEEQLLGDQPEKLDPIRVELVQGDDLRVDLPPEDVTRITTLDMVFDNSGPRKTERKTVLLNGQVFEEELVVYGFVYTADQIKNPEALSETASVDTSALLVEGQENLNNFWKQIEYQKTTYNYEELNLKVRVRAKNTEGDDLDVVYLDSGNTSATKFNSKYLTSIVTTGWKLTRFQTEELSTADTAVEDVLDTRLLNLELADINFTTNPDGSITPDVAPSTDEIDFYIKTLQSLTFKKTPFNSITQYVLEPSEDYYNDIESTPFQIQEVSGAEAGYPNESRVVIAIPDRQWTYPMVVLEETTLSQSFDSIDNPRNVFIRADRENIINDGTLTPQQKIEGLQETPLLEDLAVGEDTYERILRKILRSKFTNPNKVGVDKDQETDIFIEYVNRASSHDQNYENSIQNTQFKSIASRPTGATVFQERFDSNNLEEQDEESSDRLFEYRLTSSRNPDVEVIDSVQYETNVLSKAQAAARADLSIRNFLSGFEEQVDLAWYYPEIRPGDFIEYSDDAIKGLRKVKNISFTVDYQDYVNDQILVTCSGTQLNLGKWEDKSFTTRKVRKSENDSGNLDISTSIKGERTLGRSVFLSIRTRRNKAALPITPISEAI